jgi:hypothetical protein
LAWQCCQGWDPWRYAYERKARCPLQKPSLHAWLKDKVVRETHHQQ